MTKLSHSSYDESIILEPDIIMKPGWLHFKAGKGYQPGIYIFLLGNLYGYLEN